MFRHYCPAICPYWALRVSDYYAVIQANLLTIAKEYPVKLFKKTQNCLFVEEERYKWAAKKSGMSRHLITVSVLCLFVAFLFGALR